MRLWPNGVSSLVGCDKLARQKVASCMRLSGERTADQNPTYDPRCRASRILVCRHSPQRWSTKNADNGELVTPYMVPQSDQMLHMTNGEAGSTRHFADGATQSTNTSRAGGLRKAPNRDPAVQESLWQLAANQAALAVRVSDTYNCLPLIGDVRACGYRSIRAHRLRAAAGRS